MPKRRYKNYENPLPKSTFYRNKAEIRSQTPQIGPTMKIVKLGQLEINVETSYNRELTRNSEKNLENYYTVVPDSLVIADDNEQNIKINNDDGILIDKTFSEVDLARATVALFFSGNLTQKGANLTIQLLNIVNKNLKLPCNFNGCLKLLKS